MLNNFQQHIRRDQNRLKKQAGNDGRGALAGDLKGKASGLLVVLRLLTFQRIAGCLKC